MLKRISSLVVISILIMSLSGVALAAPSSAPANGVIPGQYIVVLKGDVANPAAVANEMALAHGLGLMNTYGAALKGFASTIPAARLEAVRSDPRVQFISENREVSIDAQTLPTGVDRIQGDASSTLSGNGSGTVNIKVAVIDTGIDLTHPDLNVLGGVNCSTGPSFKDGHGHGTHVSGTIAAKDDGNGVVGMAPGAGLYAVRVLNNAGSGSWASVACGIDWVTANAASLGIKVANMSLGGTGSDDGNCGNSNNDALHLAICNSVAAGVTYVVAAGNSNADMAGFVPAAYNEVLAVTALADFNGQPGGGAAATCRTDVDETPADFSNFTTVGSSDVGHTIAGPGVCILSTWKGGGYNTISGTSMASPHVAGTAALCIATGACSGSPSNVLAKLRNDAAAQPAYYGFVGDPNNPLPPSGGPNPKTRYYGYLVYAGGY
jgi:subtilisin